jgi:lysyl endopeptidase
MRPQELLARTMRAWLPGVASAAMLLSLAACGGGDAPVTRGQPVQAAAQSRPAAITVKGMRRGVHGADAPAAAKRLTSGTAPAITLGADEARRAQASARLFAKSSGRKAVGFPRAIADTATAQKTARRITWRVLPGGGKVGELTIVSETAVATRLGILVTRLPERATLRFFAPDDAQTYEVTGRQVLASIRRNRDAGDSSDAARTYWAPRVKGPNVTIEIELPPHVDTASVEIALPLLSHIYDAIPTGLSGACELDVSCYAAYSNESDATARMNFVSEGVSYECSGTLLNDRFASGTPWFLSANHCISDQTAASTLQTDWFYRSTSCDSDILNPQYRTLWGGATLLYATDETDTAFMRLSDPAPAGAYFAAWSAEGLAYNLNVAALHHPIGDMQKVSLGNVIGFKNCAKAPDAEYFTCSNATPADSTFFTVTNYLGVVEPGSSGSAVYRSDSATPPNRYVVGQLYGSPASCYAPAASGAYGRFDVAYNTALHHWLNEANSESDPDRLFNWAEVAYANFFAGSGVPGAQLGYTYRFYAATGNYLAVRDGRVVVHNGANWKFLDVGAVSDYMPLVTAAGF